MKKNCGMLHSGSQLICESKSPLYVDCLKSRYKMRNETNLPKKKQNKKKQKKKKRQVPRVRIFILTGTAFAVQCSTH